ncbi:MAG: TIR domain-containing protein [Anaerolineaceae bacterium]
MTAPKLFISYSWSSLEHEQMVFDLATELRQSGVDVILDDQIKEGHDAIAFMEKMVVDPEVKKVAIICDKKYALKADGRTGGVGTETQIISKEIYEKQGQEKFVVIVTEKEDDGQPCLPTYYKSRKYLDFCEISKYAENFDRLLRWIFNKPFFVKPELGNMPSYLMEGDNISLGTSVLFNRSIEGIKNDKSYKYGAFDEYLSTFAKKMELFRIVDPVGEFDVAVIKSLEEFLPYRNEVIQLIQIVAQYSSDISFAQNSYSFEINHLYC